MKHEDDIGRIRDAVADLSRQLFSKKYRLEIAALIAAGEPPIWARQLARTLDIGENQAASELAEFEKLGALQRFPSDFDRRKLYVVLPHWLWGWTREAIEEGIRAIEPDVGDELVAKYWTAMLQGDSPRPVPVGESKS